MTNRPQSHEVFCVACRKIAPLVLGVTLFLVLTFPAALGQSTPDAKMRISQVYTRGGEAGAIYQSDLVELFNAGNSFVDINGWTLNITSFEGSSISRAGIKFLSSSSIPVPPGAHLLFQFTTGGTNGQPVAGDIPVPFISLGSGGQIALVGKDQSLGLDCPASPDPSGAVVDYLGYGSASCAEGTSSPAPSTTKALVRLGGGCTDTNNNLNDFPLADPNPHNLLSPFTVCAQSSSIINLAVPQFDSFEGAGKATITVTRTGDVSTPATVDYSTSDGTATERNDYTTTLGTLRFAAGETQKTFDVLVTDDGLAELNETLTLGLLNATGNAVIGVRSSAQLVIHDNDSPSSSNVIDTSGEFVDQHYHDFLNRVPDGVGLAFWIGNIESCGSDMQCREVKRIDTSAAFFLSIEFQNTGFLVYRLYKASLPATTPRPRGFPRYREFVRDTQTISRGVIVNNPGWELQIESNTVDFINLFVARAEFLANYPTSLTPFQYVDKLNAQAGNVLSTAERNALVNSLISQQETRATVLRKIAEHPAFVSTEFNRAFVLMQYFGYLCRNPDDSPNSDFSGYDFWLNKLNQFNGDYKGAEMVKAFITSSEYRSRFGPQ